MGRRQGTPSGNRRRVSAALLLARLQRERKIEIRLARRLEAPFLSILDAARRSLQAAENVEAFLRRVNAAVEEQRGPVRQTVRESGEASAAQGYERAVKDLRRLGVEVEARPVSQSTHDEIRRQLDDETFRSLDVLPNRLLKASEFLLSKRSTRPLAKKLARALAKAASTYSEVRGELAANEDQGTGWWQWFNRGDERVRGSHRDEPRGVGREVRRVGVMFSNGCRYPRDPLADISETAGCRCRTKPVLPPTGGSDGSGSGDGQRPFGDDKDDMNPIDRMILEAAQGKRELSNDDLDLIARHVARQDFSRAKKISAKNYVRGKRWGGKTLRRGDWIDPLQEHYFKHVDRNEEWPAGTTPTDYVRSIKEVITDPDSGIYTSDFGTTGYVIAFVRRSRNLKGTRGSDWTMVEYSPLDAVWKTSFQPRDGLDWFTDNPGRRNGKWLRPPK